MAIAEQFTGIDMEQLVGAPLVAACEAQLQLADATAGFIQQVGTDKNGAPRTSAFFYQQGTEPDEQGGHNSLRIDVPMLAMVPIPNLQIDEVALTFDMEVRQSERKDTSMEAGGTLDGGIGLGMAKVSMRGTVSSHTNHTRQSDYSAKYHFEIRAANHGVPEALERVRDMMLSGIAPAPAGDLATKQKSKQVESSTMKEVENEHRKKQE